MGLALTSAHRSAAGVPRRGAPETTSASPSITLPELSAATTQSPQEAVTPEKSKQQVLPNSSRLPALEALSPYEPRHIGNLIAAEYQNLGRNIRARSALESACAGIIAGSYSHLAAASLDGPLSAAVAITSACIAAAGMWRLRGRLSETSEDFADTIVRKDFSSSPAYNSASEALASARTKELPREECMIALRHALTYGVILDRAGRFEIASEALHIAKTRVPATLTHIDCAMNFAASLTSQASDADIRLLRTNLESLFADNSALGRLEKRLTSPACSERLREFRDWLSDSYVETLVRARFDDPRSGASAMGLALQIIDGIAVPRDETSKVRLSALRENVIERLLGEIPQIPSPFLRLMAFERAAKISGLEQDQKVLIRNAVEALEAGNNLTLDEEPLAQNILTLLDNSETQRAPKKLAA